MVEKKLLNVKELSHYVSVPVCVLYKWVSQRKIPFVKLGHSTRFDQQAIDRWIEENSKLPEVEKLSKIV